MSTLTRENVFASKEARLLTHYTSFVLGCSIYCALALVVLKFVFFYDTNDSLLSFPVPHLQLLFLLSPVLGGLVVLYRYTRDVEGDANVPQLSAQPQDMSKLFRENAILSSFGTACSISTKAWSSTCYRGADTWSACYSRCMSRLCTCSELGWVFNATVGKITALAWSALVLVVFIVGMCSVLQTSVSSQYIDSVNAVYAVNTQSSCSAMSVDLAYSATLGLIMDAFPRPGTSFVYNALPLKESSALPQHSVPFLVQLSDTATNRAENLAPYHYRSVREVKDTAESIYDSVKETDKSSFPPSNPHLPDAFVSSPTQFFPSVSAPTPVTAAPSLWLLYSVIEEVGWSSFALPFFLRATKYRVLPAALALGLVWVIWHLPYVVLGTGGDWSNDGHPVETVRWFLYPTTGSSWLVPGTQYSPNATHTPLFWSILGMSVTLISLRVVLVLLVVLSHSIVPAIVLHATHNALVLGWLKRITAVGEALFLGLTPHSIAPAVIQPVSAEYSSSLMSSFLGGEASPVLAVLYALVAVYLAKKYNRSAFDWFTFISNKNSHASVQWVSSTSTSGSYNTNGSTRGAVVEHTFTVVREGYLTSLCGIPLLSHSSSKNDDLLERGQKQYLGEVVVITETVEKDQLESSLQE